MGPGKELSHIILTVNNGAVAKTEQFKIDTNLRFFLIVITNVLVQFNNRTENVTCSLTLTMSAKSFSFP